MEANKDILLICGDCGHAIRIGADIQRDWLVKDNIIYNMYSYECEKSTSFTAENFAEKENYKPIYKILYSKGKEVMMETGYYAKLFIHDQFEDIWYPDFIFQVEGKGFEYFKEEMAKWDIQRHTVNMNALLRELTEEEAEALSHCPMKGLNWKGTKWETEYNSR